MQAQTDIHTSLSEYLARIKQIDEVVAAPVFSLIDLGYEPWDAKSLSRSYSQEEVPPQSLCFPPWIAEHGKPFIEPDRRLWLTTAQCCGALQRVWRQRRRFAWLDRRRPGRKEKEIDRLKGLRKIFASTFRPEEPSLKECLKLLDSPTYGSFNVFSAAQIFRVLVNEGEVAAHGAMGFLAFFRIIWALLRRFPDSLSSGASLGNLPASAYLTAKCLLPIHKLTKTCWRRRRFFREIAELVKDIEKEHPREEHNANLYQKWLFSMRLQKLVRLLHDVSEISLNQRALASAADEILSIAKETSLPTPGRWQRAKVELEKALEKLSVVTSDPTNRVALLSEAQQMLGEIRTEIVGPLEGISAHPPHQDPSDVIQVLRVLPNDIFGAFERALIEAGDEHRYVEDLRQAAKGSWKLAEECFQLLDQAAELASRVVPEVRLPRHVDSINIESAGEQGSDCNKGEGTQSLETRDPDIVTVLEHFADANDRVGHLVNDAVSLSARWCRSVVEREIAHVSAGNRTDFDPSELVSGIAVAVRWDELTTPQQVSDAVGKAVLGAREDGSWSPGQPFYSRDYTLNAFVATSEIIGMLAGSLALYPKVKEADGQFTRYLDWLERTRIEIGPGRQRLSGWSSDRSKNRKRIDLWATAVAINTLLEIRDLFEFRIWELCEARFTVIEPRQVLAAMDPVDLDRPYNERLNYRLMEMARVSGGDEFDDANYSLVLHGPPGSSKTTVAEAIARESWTGSLRWGLRNRLVRITPADFTGGGEERIDSEARLIFDLLGHLRGVTILFDEIDDLLRKRPALRTEMRFLDLVVPAMLNRLADLREACPRQEICFLVATNFVEKIDPALIRKGRIDDPVYVGYPDYASRRMMFQRIIGAGTEGPEGSRVASGLENKVAAKTAGWPWKTLETLLKNLRSMIQRGDGNLEEALDRDLYRLGRSFSEPEYAPRVAHALECIPLADEFRSHLASLGASDEGAEKVALEKRRLRDALKRDLDRSLKVSEIEEILGRFGGRLSPTPRGAAKARTPPGRPGREGQSFREPRPRGGTP